MPDIPILDPDSLSAHAAMNRRSWNADSDTYQSDHGIQLAAKGGPGWGVWQIPEAELRILGEVEGRDVLGLAQTGKKTLFTLLSGREVPAARKTGEAIEGIAPIHDSRVDALSKL